MLVWCLLCCCPGHWLQPRSHKGRFCHPNFKHNVLSVFRKIIPVWSGLYLLQGLIAYPMGMPPPYDVLCCLVTESTSQCLVTNVLKEEKKNGQEPGRASCVSHNLCYQPLLCGINHNVAIMIIMHRAALKSQGCRDVLIKLLSTSTKHVFFLIFSYLFQIIGITLLVWHLEVINLVVLESELCSIHLTSNWVGSNYNSNYTGIKSASNGIIYIEENVIPITIGQLILSGGTFSFFLMLVNSILIHPLHCSLFIWS